MFAFFAKPNFEKSFWRISQIYHDFFVQKQQKTDIFKKPAIKKIEVFSKKTLIGQINYFPVSPHRGRKTGPGMG